MSCVADGLYLDEASPAAAEGHNRHQADTIYHFGTGRPDLDSFPMRSWLQEIKNAMDHMALVDLQYSGPEGVWALRQQIASWLLRSRGLQVDAKDVFITSGATQALFLLAGILKSESRPVMIVEDPCHIGMLRALQKNGVSICPVSADLQGIQTDGLKGDGVCAVYVTPSHQFPLGGILPAQRRAALLRFAQKNSLYIIEDDYDSEFRFSGAKIAPMFSLDQNNVIYVGTFSKILFPSLRIGYVILPVPLQKRWRETRVYTDVQNPVLEQYAAAGFLHTRKMDRHIQNMQRIYAQRRKTLLDALKAEQIKGWEIYGDAAGLHLVVSFPGMRFDKLFYKNCRAAGIYVTPADYYCIKNRAHDDKLLLGYAHLPPKEIINGIPELFKRIDAMNDSH